MEGKARRVAPESHVLASCLDHLRALPFIDDARMAPASAAAADMGWDGELVARVQSGEMRWIAEIKAGRVDTVALERLRTRLIRRDPGRSSHIMLMASHVPESIAARLPDEIDFVDVAGNLRVRVGRQYIAIVTGKRPTTAFRPTPTRPASYSVMFAILVDPDLVDEPVRTIAEHAGVSKSTVSLALAALEESGIIGRTRRHRRLVEPEKLQDRWVAGYRDVVRPRLFGGRFRVREPEVQRLESKLDDLSIRWAWGGGVAAEKLTGHYRGSELLVHFERIPDPPRVCKVLQALPSKDGELVVMGVPGPRAFVDPRQRSVHPLLVMSELMAEGSDRAIEAAREIQQRFIRAEPT